MHQCEQVNKLTEFCEPVLCGICFKILARDFNCPNGGKLSDLVTLPVRVIYN